MRILLVDDDPDFAGMVKDYLDEKGQDVVLARDGKAMREELARSEFEIVMVDLILPEEHGLALTQYLREHTDCGIIMMSGAGNLVDRVVSLELGADDFLQKPFELRELLARINSLHRRIRATGAASSRHSAKSLGFSGWRLDLQTRRLQSPAKNEVPLTSTEFALLRTLISRPNEDLSRDELMREIKGRNVEGYGRNIDVHVLRLRQKIEPNPAEPAILKTVHGVGYTFCADVVAEK